MYAGFSLGGFHRAESRPRRRKARGLLLLHATSDMAEDAKVDELPVQLHVAEPDAFEPGDWLDTWYLRMRRAGADVEIFRYRGRRAPVHRPGH